MSWKEGGADSRVVALVMRGREIPLADGRYLIGRGEDCDIMVDDTRASRRHASLRVFGRTVSIIDLESSNGVIRNGKRLPVGPHVLAHGDIVRVGREEIQVLIAGARANEFVPWSPVPLETSADSVGQEPGPMEVEDSASSTLHSVGVQMVLVVGEKALEEGRLEEAEAIVRPYLVHVMRRAVKQHEAAPGTYSAATAFALRLASATGSGEWFDYAVELLRLRKTPCTGDLARELLGVAQVVGAVELRCLEDYARALRGDSLDVRSVQRTQWIDEIIREVRHQARPSVEPESLRSQSTMLDLDRCEREPKTRDRK